MRHEPPELLTRPEAAELLRVSQTTVSRLISAGQLGSVKVGRQIRISRDAIDRYLAGSAPERQNVNPLRDPDMGTWPPTESLLSQLDRWDGRGAPPEQLDAAERAAGLR